MFQPETVEPISVDFRGLTVLTSPPNTHGFLLLRALRAVDELGITGSARRRPRRLDACLPSGQRLCARRIWLIRGTSASTSPRLSTKASTEMAELGAVRSGPAVVPHGDTVGVAAAGDDGYAVSLIRSVYHAFGSGADRPRHRDSVPQSRNQFLAGRRLAECHRAAQTTSAHLMPVTDDATGRATPRPWRPMGGQGQPQILAQVLLRERSAARARRPRSPRPDAVVGLASGRRHSRFGDGGVRPAGRRRGPPSDVPAWCRQTSRRTPKTSDEASVVFADARGIDDGGFRSHVRTAPPSWRTTRRFVKP